MLSKISDLIISPQPISQIIKNHLQIKTVRLISKKSNFKPFSHIQSLPPDPIFDLLEQYQNCKSTNKVNLSIGEYRDENGNPLVLEVVKNVEKDLASRNLPKDNLPIDGDPKFYEEATKLLLGPESKYIKEKRVCSIQCLSGTGGLRLTGELIKRCSKNKTIYLPDPTWVNHAPIFKKSGLEMKIYRYYNNGLNFSGLIEDLENAKENSFVVFHACSHNPTGTDPTEKQWKKILKTVKKKNLVPIFDTAYLGFSSGNYDKDAFAIRLAAEQEIPSIIAQSFSKNLGLYSERIGCLSILCDTQKEAENLRSQLKAIILPMYSNPPIHGSLIVGTILENSYLIRKWKAEMKEMQSRISEMRSLVYKELTRKKTKRSWKRIISHSGMFTFSDLTEKHVKILKEKYSIFVESTGRISMGGINHNNINYLVSSIHEVLQNEHFSIKR
ncbi:aspartate aminotransferase [Anaeramoeba ignava]|uniref:Aspartate aminotransferase n=1 Tax=Anaeramoeba ignava TaxID=1746090 RepID=A0A9Q0RG26_ANAIG|nr:aspartate aminotransferase [Anaeramoeba ignava]